MKNENFFASFKRCNFILLLCRIAVVKRHFRINLDRLANVQRSNHGMPLSRIFFISF